MDADLRLLAGDALYALGLSRLAEAGDLEAVAELADLISLSALRRRPRAAPGERRGPVGGERASAWRGWPRCRPRSTPDSPGVVTPYGRAG